MTQSILFVCNMNSVRSPMAAALMRLAASEDYRIDSAGIYEGGLDPFVGLVMLERGVSLEEHEPKTIDDADLKSFDVVIALTPEAAVETRRRLPHERIEFWDIDNPSEERGGRDAILESYRRVRDELQRRINERFPDIQEKP